jgi:glycosyltransferase 2 family protein
MAILLFLAAAIAGVCSLFYSLRSAPAGEGRLSRWPRLAGLVGRARNLILLVRTRPWHLLAAFALSLVIHACVVTSIVMVAAAAGIGELATSDYMFAVPLTLVANAVPLTPNGIGVGEAAFDQICRWLEPVPTGAAYSSIFLAFRAICMLACLPGFASLALYRNIPKPPT